jgi:hypothetical protein
MPRCPLCASAQITIVIRSLHPLAFCSSCGARWTQVGSEQSAIKRAQPPALLTSTRRASRREPSAGQYATQPQADPTLGPYD